MTVYFNTYVNHLASRAQSLTNMSIMWNSPTPPLFDLLTFDILTQESVSRGRSIGQIEVHVFEKNAYRLSSSLFPPFFARSLFHCSLAFLLVHTDREPGTGTQHLGTGAQDPENHTLFSRTYALSLNKGASPTVSKRIVLLAVSVSALYWFHVFFPLGCRFSTKSWELQVGSYHVYSSCVWPWLVLARS